MLNPSTLHFSRRWSVIRAVFWLCLLAALLWALSQSRLFEGQLPPPPPSAVDFGPHDDPLADMERIRAAQTPQYIGLDQLTDGWFNVIVLLACFPIALWEISKQFWRLFASSPALQVQNGQLMPHASLMMAPAAISVGMIRSVILDRSDLVRPDNMRSMLMAFSWSNKLGLKVGARLRHTLLIEYGAADGDCLSFRINDSDVEGGVGALDRFATYLLLVSKVA